MPVQSELVRVHFLTRQIRCKLLEKLIFLPSLRPLRSFYAHWYSSYDSVWIVKRVFAPNSKLFLNSLI